MGGGSVAAPRYSVALGKVPLRGVHCEKAEQAASVDEAAAKPFARGGARKLLELLVPRGRIELPTP